MFNSINISALLDLSQELSLDDLDLVLGGGANNVSAAGAGDDQPQHGGAANGLDLRTSPVTLDAKVDVHGDGTSFLDQAGQALNHLVQTVDHIADEGATTVIHLVDPIFTAR